MKIAFIIQIIGFGFMIGGLIMYSINSIRAKTMWNFIKIGGLLTIISWLILTITL